MIGGEAVDDVQIVPQSLPVNFRAQRWLHPTRHRSHSIQIVMGQEQMMGAHFAGDLYPFLFGCLNQQNLGINKKYNTVELAAQASACLTCLPNII